MYSNHGRYSIKSVVTMFVVTAVVSIGVLHVLSPATAYLRYPSGSLQELAELNESGALRAIYQFEGSCIVAYASRSGVTKTLSGSEATAACEMELACAVKEPGSQAGKPNVISKGFLLVSSALLALMYFGSYLPGEQEKAAFLARTEEYLPLLGENGNKTVTNRQPNHGAKHKGTSPINKAKCVSRTQEQDHQHRSKTVTFEDIAGYSVTKQSLAFVVRCIRDTDMLQKAGAKIPKGILLYGPPGTGKTLMAAAIAGSAGVPFYSVNAASFINTYVGTGPAAIRRLYAEARENAPCVVFIDELDAVGRKRSNGDNAEYRNTTNALLSELDGIGSGTGVLTIAATNAYDALDEALTRSGRFDRKIKVPMPNLSDREQILRLLCRNKRLSQDVDLCTLAEETEGMSGADLDTLLNESAIEAVVHNRIVISRQDIERILFRMLTNGEENGVTDGRDAHIAAWHEAGHAVCMRLLGKRKVHSLTIHRFTTGLGGATLSSGVGGAFVSKQEVEYAIMGLYAGKAAEELLLGGRDEVTSAAADDIRQATLLIREYQALFCLGEQTGLLNMAAFPDCDKAVSEAYLEEASALADRLYADTVAFLSKHQRALAMIAAALEKRGSLRGEEIDRLIADAEPR